MWRAGAAVLVSLAGMGCSAESEDAPPADTCAPPKRIVGERCLEPGVQDDGCPAGTLAVGDGSCQPAGVPPELCAEGFVHDGDAGCEPILPPAPCDKGQMAIAGESACHPVMACGSGTWGDIPIDQATVHVDDTYAGGDSDGSLLRPWTSITSAVAAAPPGALIAIAAGSYVEDVDVDKPVRLWGVCPAEVELAGTADGSAALSFRPGSSGSEVRGLAITGVQLGVLVAGSADIVLEQLWIHDTLSRTVNVQSTADLTSVTLRSSLIEENHDIGVIVFGSEATLEGVVVRGTLPRARDQEAGRGIVSAISDSGSRSTAHIKSSLVERNHDLGVFVAASDATLEGLIVRGTLPRASDGGFGDGVAVAGGDPQGMLLSASVDVTSSRIEDNARAGVGNFDAHVGLGTSALSCNAFDLDGEMFFGVPFSFADLGGNGCGCPEPAGACVARSSGLAPPNTLADPP